MDIIIGTAELFRIVSPKIAAARIKAAGFDGVDWSMEPVDAAAITEEPMLYDASYECIRTHFSEQIDALQAESLRIAQMTLPFPLFIKGRIELTERMLANTEKIIRLCGELACPYLIISPLAVHKDNGLSIKETLAFNLKTYEALIPTAKKYGVTICLENNLTSRKGTHVYGGFGAYPEEAAEAIDALNAAAGEERFAFCLDVGRLDLARSDFYAYFYKMGHRIKALHVNDNAGMTDDRILPMVGGVINWPYVCRSLRGNHYEGDMTLSVSFAPYDESMIANALCLAADSARVLCRRVREG